MAKLVRSKQARVICLYGELGSGKSVFAGGFARGLGVKGRILSPTFLIMRAYPILRGGSLYHLDLYRTSNMSEIKDLGFTEIIESDKNVILIEWAERLREFLPKERIDINFRVLNEEKHEIKIWKI